MAEELRQSVASRSPDGQPLTANHRVDTRCKHKRQ
jgi:hypothetical protein